MHIIRSSRLYICYYRLWCAVLGCWLSGVRCRAAGYAPGKRDVARLAVVQHPSSWTGSLVPCTWHPTTRNQALHTIDSNNTHIVSSSWWCAEKCPKHVEHIISAMNHSVASSWFFFFYAYCVLAECFLYKANRSCSSYFLFALSCS